MIEVDTSALERLNRAMTRYQLTQQARHPSSTVLDVLRHVGENFAIFLRRQLKELAPNKGEVTQTNMARLRAKDGGIKISQKTRKFIGAAFTMPKKRSKYGPSSKLNTQQQLVARELASRESARGFLAYSVPKPAKGQNGAQVLSKESHQLLSEFAIGFTHSEATASLSWTNPTAVRGLAQPAATAAVTAAMQSTAADLESYVQGRITEGLSKAFAKAGVA